MKDSKIMHGTEISGPEMVADKAVKTPKKMASKTARFLSKSVKGAVKGTIEAKTVDVKMPVGEAIAKPMPETEVPKMDISRPTKVSMRSVAELAKTPHPVITPKAPKHNVAHESVYIPHESVRTPIHNTAHESVHIPHESVRTPIHNTAHESVHIPHESVRAPIHNTAHESVRIPRIHNRVHEDKIDKVVHNRTSRKTIDTSNIQASQADMSEQFE